MYKGVTCTSYAGLGTTRALTEDKVLDYDIKAYLLSDMVCYRSINEDRIKNIRPGDSRLLPEKELFAIMIDGMGGHQAGGILAPQSLRETGKPVPPTLERTARAL